MSFEIYEQYENDYYGEWYDYDSQWQDASGYLLLYERGCVVGNGWNCTAACLDQDVGPNLAWNTSNSTYTLHNCMVLPFIAYLLANGSLTPAAVNTSRFYGIPSDASLVHNKDLGWPVINNCINAYCDTSVTPGCDKNNGMQDDFTLYANETVDNGPNVTLPVGFNTGLCWSLDAVINPDLGGIGMFVSYLMQTIIILGAWLLFHIFDSWVQYPITITLLPFKGLSRASTIASKVQEDASEHKEALIDAMKDFQIAQVFFMMSVQVASIIAIKNPDYIEATSWQQLWNNVGILYNVEMGGCIPVVFAAIVIRAAGKRDIYPLIWTTCCVFLSAAVWMANYNTALYPNDVKYDGQPIAACGGNIAPIKYCYSYDWYYNNADSSDKGYPMVVFSIMVQICLVLDRCCFFSVFDEQTGAKTKVNVFTKLRQMILAQHKVWDRYEQVTLRRPLWKALHVDTRENVLKSVYGAIILATECACAALNFVLITDYARLLPSSEGAPKALDLKAWSLGQVIAVAIWIPVLLSYFWYGILGMKEEPNEATVSEDNTHLRKFREEDHGDPEILASTPMVDLPPLEPVGKRGPTGRIGYERVNSNNWPDGQS